jgi:SulP family sulfate permease
MRHVPFVDSTALHNFEETIKTLQDSNVKLILSGVNAQVLEDLKKYKITNLIGEENILSSFERALKRSAEINATDPL